MKKLPIGNSHQQETVSNEPPAPTDHGGLPDITRRQMGVGLLALAAGGLGLVKKAQAFESGAHGNFNAAGSVLGRYGVAVKGDESIGDLLSFEILPLPNTDYSQIVGTERNSIGGIIPCVKTVVFADDVGDVSLVEATHFHARNDGLIIPCVKTTIEGHTEAIHELFDTDTFDKNTGKIQTSFKVAADMDGGHIGKVVATHFHPNADGFIIPCVRTTIEGDTKATHELFDGGAAVPSLTVESEMLDGGKLGEVKVVVGGNTYKLVGGVLVLDVPVPT